MALNITISATSGTAVTEVPEDVASDLRATYDALKDLPNTRVATAEFDTPQLARLFVRQGTAWAAANNLEFVRKAVPGYEKISDMPNHVSFRIYVPAPADSPRRAPRPRKDK